MASSKFPMISKSFRLIGAHEPALLRQKLLPAGVALSQARRQGTRTSRSFQPVIPILEKYDPNRQFPVPWKPNFYSELKDALKRRVNSFITFFYVPSSLGGKFYSPAFWTQLGQTAKDLYVQMNTAFARKDEIALRQVVTEGLFMDLVKDMRKSKAKHDWSLEWPSGTAGYAKPVLMRMAEAPNNSKIIQITYRLTSKQKIADHATSKVLAEMDNVREYIVINAIAEGKQTKWKICGKL